MSDLISRQAAIDILKNRWKKTRNYEGIGDDIAEECELYLKQVQSAQPEQQWISCSERLPKVAQRVLLSGHGQVMVGMLHSFGKYSLEPTGISYAYPKDDIEAWMPLPEPYQEGEQDE